MTAMTTEYQDLNVTVLADLLENTDPELFVPALAAETEEELTARRQAAADITDDLIEANVLRDGIEHVAELVSVRVDRWAEQAQADVAGWLPQIRGAAA